MMRLALVLLFASLAAACKAPVGVNNLSVAPDSGPRCAALCGDIGMPLDSVVIMADNVGCVCRAAIPAPQSAPPPAAEVPPAATPVTGAASAGGMAAILIQRQKQKRSQQHHHHRPHK
jgi:hypothetical protein